MNLKAMPVDKLIGLRNRVQTALANRVAEQRRTLESELAKLTRFGTGGARRTLAGGKIAPKYRNPDNPSETWAVVRVLGRAQQAAAAPYVHAAA
jgi:DNA-binding protein H-NS